jgi:hypothetical protein
MDCDTSDPNADKAADEEFEMLPKDTARLSLGHSELQPGADGACNSATGEENVPLQSKDGGLPVSLTYVTDLESRQSSGSESLIDVINTRKESGVDGLEGIDNKCGENKGTEEKVTEGTKEFYSDANKAVTDGSIISGKGILEEYAELNIKEKHEHEEVYVKQKKETEDVNHEEKKDLEELNGKKEIEVVNRIGKESKEISDEEKNKIEDVTDEVKESERKKVNGREKENEVSIEEKDKKVLSDKEKEEVGEQSNSEKSSEVIEPENDRCEGKDELEATELLSCENKDTIENKSKEETGITTSKAGSGECEINVDDPDAYPGHINFVDVNAPNCDSPMVIDDDDEEEEIVMIERRKGTSQKGRTDNNEVDKADSSNRDSSPEVVLQEKLCRRRQEIVIELDDDDDDDDDDIEIESIKKKKKNKSDAPRGACCCNVECSAPSQDLNNAPVFVLTYYGRKYRKGKPEKVCPLCFEVAMQHQEVSVCVIVYICISCQQQCCCVFI